MSERVSTIVIGGGQAGLTVAYHLAKRGLPFVLLDAGARAGDAWRNRWDSLRLFTPARYTGLPGLRFPAKADAFPTKDQMADYLELYASHFELPVRTGVKVDHLTRQGERFVVSAGSLRFESDQVVVAMANYQTPRIPRFAADLNPEITQLHSHDYRNPAQLQPGAVLIVGAGNSGADIAIEVAQASASSGALRASSNLPANVSTTLIAATQNAPSVSTKRSMATERARVNASRAISSSPNTVAA